MSRVKAGLYNLRLALAAVALRSLCWAEQRRFARSSQFRRNQLYRFRVANTPVVNPYLACVLPGITLGVSDPLCRKESFTILSCASRFDGKWSYFSVTQQLLGHLDVLTVLDEPS
jgi:hypothetical protein